MLKIDRIRLRLPAGYDSRADGIARRLASELAARPWPGPARLERIDVGTLTVEPGTTDVALAGSIASAIRHAAAGSRGGERR